MEFIAYQHLERFGTKEVDGIQIGTVYVFPKIDGSNASLWLNDKGKLQAGSRRRTLTLEQDNGGFLEWALRQYHIIAYLEANPTQRLYGEWLIPHSLKNYRENAWRRFYVFDVAVDINYLPYETYKEELDAYKIDYIPPIAVIKNGSYELFIKHLAKNLFLVEDGKGAGEGIVLKNYDFINEYGRKPYAKIVTSEFKEAHAKIMGVRQTEATKMIEDEIVGKYVTVALCEKVKAKIELRENGWSSKLIPVLLNEVYYDLIKEESYSFVSEHNNPRIDFKTLHHFTTRKIKESLPDIF
jgi:hypothetical protein